MAKRQAPAQLSNIHNRVDELIPALRTGVTTNEDGSITISPEAVEAAIVAKGTTLKDLRHAQEVTTDITAAAIGAIGEHTHNYFADSKNKAVETVDYSFAVGHSKSEGQAVRSSEVTVPNPRTGETSTKTVNNRLNTKTHNSYGKTLNKTVLNGIAALQDLGDDD